MEHDPEGHERLQAYKRRRDEEPENEANRASVARENEGDLAHQERQDVEMLVEAPVESASVKCRSDAVADNEESARVRLRSRGQKEARNTICKTYWNPRPRRGPDWSRGVRSVKSTQPLPDLEEEVTWTVPC